MTISGKPFSELVFRGTVDLTALSHFRLCRIFGGSSWC